MERIMYIENKGNENHIGISRIGRVKFSKTKKTIYYKDKTFETLSGRGFKSNYYDTKTGENYWISGCKKRGNDTLYPGIIEIDDDVREEYWINIRNMPEKINVTKMKTTGKYTK